MILVTGGTGTLGRALVAALGGRKHRVLSRRPGHTFGDLDTGAGLDLALSGVDTIVHCASSLRARDRAQAKRLVDAARRVGEPHLIYVSIVGVEKIPLGYYRAKLAVEQHIAASGLPWTTLRATQFHDLILRMFTIQRRLPAILVPAGTRFQPVDVRDVAGRLVELVDGGPAGRVPDFGGPQVRPIVELARAYLAGRRRPVVPVPLPGKVMRGYRDGANLGPASGVITFETFLEAR